MPKIGMEPIRRAALVEATIAEIGAAGTLDITVSQIARRAGMSSALAHHYFGGKDQIFAAAMRHILDELKSEILLRLTRAKTPHARARAIIEGSFAPSCFVPATITAWMTFYVQAQVNPEARRLLRIYQRRLRSNLRHALRGLSADADRDAETLAALIDGLYIRMALSASGSASAAERIATDVLDRLIGADQ